MASEVLSKMARAIEGILAASRVPQGNIDPKDLPEILAQAALDASGVRALRKLDEQTSAAPWTHTAMQRDADADFVIACVRYVRDLLASPRGEG